VLCEKLFILLIEGEKYADAFTISELSASLGWPQGRADYAYLIYSGLGVKQNKEVGLRELQKLELEGNEQAEAYLGDIFTKLALE
jgi:hypothetical protein